MRRPWCCVEPRCEPVHQLANEDDLSVPDVRAIRTAINHWPGESHLGKAYYALVDALADHSSRFSVAVWRDLRHRLANQVLTDEEAAEYERLLDSDSQASEEARRGDA